MIRPAGQGSFVRRFPQIEKRPLPLPRLFRKRVVDLIVCENLCHLRMKAPASAGRAPLISRLSDPTIADTTELVAAGIKRIGQILMVISILMATGTHWAA